MSDATRRWGYCGVGLVLWVAGRVGGSSEPSTIDAGDGDASGDGDGDASGDGDGDASGDGDGDGDRDSGSTPLTFVADPRIPEALDDCPTLATGEVSVLGQSVQLWVGPKQVGSQGPLFFYWHGTGGSGFEAEGLGSVLDDIQAAGGMVASFTTGTGGGETTGNNVWWTGDFAMTDLLVACAVEQLDIDPRRIYTGGCGSGGLQASAMVYLRSSYLAGAMPDSGGTIFDFELEQPSHAPAVITSHGALEKDVVGIKFAETSILLCTEISASGGIAVDCDHGGNICGAPPSLKQAQWRFLEAHPFGVSPDPYEDGLPADFPDYCTPY